MSDISQNTLLRHGINPSVQRMAIMDYLLEHHTHPTVDEVYVALAETMPTLSRTTVNNTLRLFAERGAAQMLTIDEKKVCFDGCIVPHAHFMCRVCGKVYDIGLPDGWTEPPLAEGGFLIDESHIYYKGICKECRKIKEKTEQTE